MHQAFAATKHQWTGWCWKTFYKDSQSSPSCWLTYPTRGHFWGAETNSSEEEFALKEAVNTELDCVFCHFSFHCMWLSDNWVEGMRRWQQWRSWLNLPAVFSASQSKVCPCDLLKMCFHKWISSGCIRAQHLFAWLQSFACFSYLFNIGLILLLISK